MSEAEIVKWIIVGVEQLILLASKLSTPGRDAVIAGLDSALAVARAKTDEDLTAKHRTPQP